MAVVRVTGVACPICVVVSLLLLLVFLQNAKQDFINVNLAVNENL